jgi:hypothetical protein
VAVSVHALMEDSYYLNTALPARPIEKHMRTQGAPEIAGGNRSDALSANASNASIMASLPDERNTSDRQPPLAPTRRDDAGSPLPWWC